MDVNKGKINHVHRYVTGYIRPSLSGRDEMIRIEGYWKPSAMNIASSVPYTANGQTFQYPLTADDRARVLQFQQEEEKYRTDQDAKTRKKKQATARAIKFVPGQRVKVPGYNGEYDVLFKSINGDTATIQSRIATATVKVKSTTKTQYIFFEGWRYYADGSTKAASR